MNKSFRKYLIGLKVIYGDDTDEILKKIEKDARKSVKVSKVEIGIMNYINVNLHRLQELGWYVDTKTGYYVYKFYRKKG